MPKKKTKVEELEAAQKKLYYVLEAFDVEDIRSFLINDLEYDIGMTQDYIENEQEFIKNGAYPNQKAEVRAVIKAMKKKKKAQTDALKQLRRVFALVQKVTDIDV